MTTTVVWQGGTLGSWSDSVWLVEGSSPPVYVVPDAADDAIASGVTITFDGTGAANSLSMTSGALVVQGGLLQLSTGSSLDQVTQTGGTLEFGNAGDVASYVGGNAVGGYAQSGGTLTVDASVLVLQGADDLAGSATGAGDLVIGGFGIATIEASATIETATFELGVAGNGNTSSTTLEGDQAYSGTFLLDNYSGNSADLLLNGFDFLVSGISTLDGYVSGPGTFTVEGTALLGGSGYGQFQSLAGATVIDDGVMTENLGAGIAAGLTIVSGATYDIVSNSGIGNNGSASIENDGLFEKTAGTGTSIIDALFVNNGSVGIDTGTIQFAEAVSNAGTIGGEALVARGPFDTTGDVDLQEAVLQGGGTLDGTVVVSGVLALTNGGGYTLASTVALAAGTFEVDDSATQVSLQANETLVGDLALNSATINIGGFSLAVDGLATLTGLLGGSGTFTVGNAVEGNGFFVYGSAIYNDTGTVLQNGGIALGQGAADTVTLNVGTGDTYEITGAYWLGNPNLNTTGTAQVNNAGLFEMTGTGAADIYTDFSNAGSSELLVGAGGQLNFLTLDAALGGTIAGGGLLYLANSWTLEAGADLSVANLIDAGGGTLLESVDYTGSFMSYFGSGLELNGNDLTLTGTATLQGHIGGTGTLTADNAVEYNGFVVYGSAVYDDSGTILQEGGIALGSGSADTVTLNVEAGDTYDITGGYWLGNPNLNTTGVAQIDNAGLFEMTGAGGANIYTNFSNAGSAELLIGGGGELNFLTLNAVLGGTIAGDGVLYLANTWTLEAGADLSVGMLTDAGSGTLAESVSYGGGFASESGSGLALNGNTLTLTGQAGLQGYIGGTGTLTADNAVEYNGFVVYGSAVYDDAGTILQAGGIALGHGSTDTVTMNIGDGATYDIIGAFWLGNPNLNTTGLAQINNAGLFEMTGTGAATIYTDFSNTGTAESGSGGLVFTESFSNSGVVVADGGGISIDNAVTGDGTIAISGGAVDIGGSVAAGQTVVFADAGMLELGEPAQFAGTISDFAIGDTIALSSITVTGSAYAGGTLTLFESGGSITLDMPGNFIPSQFVVSNVPGGADVGLTAPCFRAGTRIDTARGEVAVEVLRVGDLVRVVSEDGFAPVVWIGRRRIDCRRHSEPRRVWPVRIEAGAFGVGRPCRDLWLSPDHAVFINEVLIPVKHLINGGSIAQVPVDTVTYFHVELPQHDVLLSDGLPTESFLDTGDRSDFENAGGCVRLHPKLAVRVREACGFAPLVVTGVELEAARAFLQGVARSAGAALAATAA